METKIIKKIVSHSQKHFEKKQKHPAIEFKNLVVDFGETKAVDNVNLRLKQGELITLLGPSGCGKTTMLNAIAGLLSPTSGKIIFKGKDVTKFSPQKRKLGLVFQNYALYPHMTVYKNIAFPLKNDVNWKSKIEKKNKLVDLKIEQIILKANGASSKELKKLETYLLNIYDVVRETSFYYNKVSSLFFEEYNTAKASYGLIKPHYENKKKNIYSKHLKETKDVKDAYKKRELNKKIKIDLAKAKEVYTAEKEKSKLAIAKAKINMKNSKWKEKLETSKLNVKKAPDAARKKYIFYRKELVSKYSLSKSSLAHKDDKKIKKVAEEKKKISQAIHESVMEVAKKLDIVPNLQKFPTKLSGGQQQRVAIARGIVKKPDILLMDEPLSNLDAKLRIEARNWIRTIQQELGITLIFVTHDQEEAMSISDTIVCLNKGRVQQLGSPMELYSKPANEFVAKFLGMPEMKLFEAKTSTTGLVKLGPLSFALGKTFAGKKIKLGVRSEKIKTGTKGIPVSVRSIELLGKDSLLRVESKDYGIINILTKGSTKLKVGNSTKISFAKSDFHIFDNSTQERLNNA